MMANLESLIEHCPKVIIECDWSLYRIMNKVQLSNPKRNYNLKVGRASWYDYYAGYSTEFVEDVISYIKPSKTAILLDPWNGSGTTTQIASQLGYRAVGYDINPVMVIVSKSKMINQASLQKLRKEVKLVVDKAKSYNVSGPEISDDPLNDWLEVTGIFPFRQIECAFLDIHQTNKSTLKANSFEEISSTVAFYYVVLFKTIKDFLKSFKSSNPTWIKRAKSNDEKVSIDINKVFNVFSFYLEEMINADNHTVETFCEPSNISVASSESLPLDARSIDAVISSPPYCTRIDYAVATILELAVLGYSNDKQLKELRDKMIGTPTISNFKYDPCKKWGDFANHLLTVVSEHESKSSRSYYYKIYLQYFDSIFNSLEEIDRVLKPGGYSVFVVQNSYYKDILIDLSKVFIEMAAELSWVLDNKFIYKKNTIAEINNKYRNSSKVEETALIFKKC